MPEMDNNMRKICILYFFYFIQQIKYFSLLYFKFVQSQPCFYAYFEAILV